MAVKFAERSPIDYIDLTVFPQAPASERSYLSYVQHFSKQMSQSAFH